MLAEQGIRLAYVRGDVTTNAIVMVVDSEVSRNFVNSSTPGST